MSGKRIVDVECRCGTKLFRYFKGGKGRLVKCAISRITTDYIGITENYNEGQPVCPECGKDLGIIKMIHGKPTLKLNQGAIKKVNL